MSSQSYLVEYRRQIKSGELIVGKELTWQVEQCYLELTDPIYQNRHNIKIEFGESEKRIRFIQAECRHFEAPHAGKPFLLEIWQKAFIECIFAIKIYDEEIGTFVRKYQEVLFLVGRKNGKTPLIGAICLSEWFCGEMGKKILCASNDYEQADLMFQAINSMREESPTLSKVTRKNIKGIFFGHPKQKKKKGKFTSQNKGSIRKLSAKTGAKEGRNIGVGAVDEVFEMADDSTVMPIRQALSTQNEPLYFELTTEGFTHDGYLDKRLIEARQVIAGEIERPRWLIWLYTQDSEQEVWQNEDSWMKSNPGLGKIKKRSFLRNMLEEAKTSSSKKAFVLAKDFNIKQNNAAAWLQEQDIANPLTYEVEDLENSIAIGGVDLSETFDLTNARVIIMRPGSKMKWTYTQYFIPEGKLDRIPKSEADKYLEWIKAGHLHLCEGDEVDYTDVVDWFVKLWKKHKIRSFKVGYDRWGSKAFVEAMEEYGFEMIRVNQDYFTMSHPMKMLESDLKNNLVNFNQHPIDIFCLKNTAIIFDKTGTKIMPAKVQGVKLNHIDGAVTMIICYVVFNENRREYLNMVR